MERILFQSEVNMKKTFAGIDIGTNTVLMTVGEGNSINDINYLEDCHAIAHLGEGVNESKKINDNAIERAKAILLNYKDICNKYNVDKINIAATSAMRDAVNSNEVAGIFESVMGFPVDIISGTEEARFSFLGTVEDLDHSSVIDIGGGSVEIISGDYSKFDFEHSYQIGAVRLTEMFFKQLPPTLSEVLELENFIEKQFSSKPLPIFSDKTYAVAGTATTLAMIFLNMKEFDKQIIHGFLLNYEAVDYCVKELLKRDISKIIVDYNIPDKRANIITAGALILRNIMRIGNIEKVIVNAHGLRYGVLKNMFLTL